MVIERVALDVTPGREEDVLRHCGQSRAMFLGMPGCRSFDYGRGVENPSKVLPLIRWDSVEAHKAAGAAGLIAPFGGPLKTMLAGPIAVEHFEMAG